MKNLLITAYNILLMAGTFLLIVAGITLFLFLLMEAPAIAFAVLILIAILADSRII